MKEKDIQTIFGKVNQIKGFFELKLAKSNRLPYSAVKPHQIKSLVLASQKGIYHKISDSPWTQRFTAKKPFDCFYLQAPAYIVVCFYQPRHKKPFFYIPINRWLENKKKSQRKSITKKEAEKIAEHYLEV